MQLPVKSNLNSFMINMENGAIYWEFSDGFRIAMHKSVYDYANSNGYKPHKAFIDKLICDKRTRFLSKMYYKAYDINNPSVTPFWVDLMAYLRTSSYTNFETYIISTRVTLSVDVSNIKSTEYIDKNFISHIINEMDGNIDLQTNYAPVLFIPMKDRSIITVNQYNINSPSEVRDQLLQDIKISMASSYGDLTNVLYWIGGLFVSADELSPNDIQNIVIQNGKSFINPILVGYKGDAPLTFKTGIDANATLDPDTSREDYRWDFNIRLFKWRGVAISNWMIPTTMDYDQYTHVDPTSHTDIVFDFLDSIAFAGITFDENHLLMMNGSIVNRDEYTIDGANGVIYLKGLKEKVVELIADEYNEYVNISTPITNIQLLQNIVEEFLPTADDFSLITFSSIDPAKTVNLHRSRNCYKNHPYPNYVAFPEYSVGDLITVDGVFEKYKITEHNVICYPDTKYRALYNTKNWLQSSIVERIFFTID